MVMKIGVANEDAEHGGTGSEIELVEADSTNHLMLVFGHDAKIAAALVMGESSEVVAFKALGENLSSATEKIGDFGVVEPFVKGFDEFIRGVDSGEENPVADEFLDKFHDVSFRLWLNYNKIWHKREFGLLRYNEII